MMSISTHAPKKMCFELNTEFEFLSRLEAIASKLETIASRLELNAEFEFLSGGGRNGEVAERTQCLPRVRPSHAVEVAQG